MKTEKELNKAIRSFTGKNRFLSNFYLAPVTIDGITYKNNEAAFQAQKCRTIEEKIEFASISNPTIAKRKGKKVLGLDVALWNKSRIAIMKEVCMAKFIQNPELREMLLSTGNAELAEGNAWGDTFWGVDSKTGKGKNNLGKVLMEIREELRGS